MLIVYYYHNLNEHVPFHDLLYIYPQIIPTSDPFDESRLVLVSDNSLIFVNDLDLCKTPNSHPKKYQLALGSKGRSDSLQPSITGDYHPHSNSMQVPHNSSTWTVSRRQLFSHSPTLTKLVAPTRSRSHTCEAHPPTLATTTHWSTQKSCDIE